MLSNECVEPVLISKQIWCLEKSTLEIYALINRKTNKQLETKIIFNDTSILIHGRLEMTANIAAQMYSTVYFKNTIRRAVA